MTAKNHVVVYFTAEELEGIAELGFYMLAKSKKADSKSNRIKRGDGVNRTEVLRQALNHALKQKREIEQKAEQPQALPELSEADHDLILKIGHSLVKNRKWTQLLVDGKIDEVAVLKHCIQLAAQQEMILRS